MQHMLQLAKFCRILGISTRTGTRWVQSGAIRAQQFSARTNLRPDGTNDTRSCRYYISTTEAQRVIMSILDRAAQAAAVRAVQDASDASHASCGRLQMTRVGVPG